VISSIVFFPMTSSTPSRLPPSSWVVVGLIVLFFSASYAGRLWLADGGRSGNSQVSVELVENDTRPQRIVALAPSTVEVLYALGLGDRVVGVSRFSSYPAEALELPKVAGFVDVDFEQLLALRPDYVVMVDSQRSLVDKFDELGIMTLSVNHATVDGIIDSFGEISAVCGNQNEALRITREMRAHIAAVKDRVKDLDHPSVLISIERDTDLPQPDQVIAAGNSGFHQELIELAGGVNAYQGSIAFPKLSREKLINLNPDIVIDLIRDQVIAHRPEKELLRQWGVYQELEAVKTHRVVIVSGNQHLIPGPRFLDTLDVFVTALHKK